MIADWMDEHPEWQKFADLVVMPPSLAEVVQDWPEAEGEAQLEHEWTTSYGVTNRALYCKLRRQKQTHQWALMIATQRGPRVMTDAVFFEGGKRPADEMTPGYLKMCLRNSAAHGFTPTSNHRYYASLARFPGDPQAWVNQSDGRGYIQKLCEQRGWACEGAVNLKAREPERDPVESAVPLAPDVIRANARRMIQQNPSLARKSRKELTQMVLEKHGPSK